MAEQYKAPHMTVPTGVVDRNGNYHHIRITKTCYANVLENIMFNIIK